MVSSTGTVTGAHFLPIKNGRMEARELADALGLKQRDAELLRFRGGCWIGKSLYQQDIWDFHNSPDSPTHEKHINLPNDRNSAFLLEVKPLTFETRRELLTRASHELIARAEEERNGGEEYIAKE